MTSNREAFCVYNVFSANLSDLAVHINFSNPENNQLSLYSSGVV